MPMKTEEEIWHRCASGALVFIELTSLFNRSIASIFGPIESSTCASSLMSEPAPKRQVELFVELAAILF